MALPEPRQRRSGVDRHDAYVRSALGQTASEVQLRDVSPEQVLQVDRGDQQVHPAGRVLARLEVERGDLLRDRARRGALEGDFTSGPWGERGGRNCV